MRVQLVTVVRLNCEMVSCLNVSNEITKKISRQFPLYGIHYNIIDTVLVCIHIHTYMYVYVHMYCVGMYVCVILCMHAFLGLYNMSVYTYIQMHASMYLHMCVCDTDISVYYVYVRHWRTIAKLNISTGGGCGRKNTGCLISTSQYTPVNASVVYNIQWGLFIKDTLGPANLSSVERLSTLQRWKMY